MKTPKDIIQFILRPLVVLVLFICAFFFFLSPASPFSLNLEMIRSHIATLGYWGPLYFILSVVILELFSFPMVPLIMTAGILFGKLGGVFISVVATTSSALVSWAIARYLVKDAFRNRILAKLGAFSSFLLQKSSLHIAVSRSLPVPFSITSYASGFIYKDIKPVFWGNIAGITPWCFIYTWLSGYLLDNKLIVIFFILMLILLIETILYLYWQKKKSPVIDQVLHE